MMVPRYSAASFGAKPTAPPSMAVVTHLSCMAFGNNRVCLQGWAGGGKSIKRNGEVQRVREGAADYELCCECVIPAWQCRCNSE